MRSRVLILGHNDATQFIDIFNQYTRLFDQKHYEVTVAMLTGKPNEATQTRLLAEHVLFLNTPKRKLRGLKLGVFWRLLRLTRQQHYDIVICHRYKPTYLMLWVSQFVRFSALICVMHELGTMKARGRQWLMRRLGRASLVFAGVSDAVRDDLRASLQPFPKERIVTLYNVIDTDLIEPTFADRATAREALSLPADRFIFGNIARLAVNKDHRSLITAFAEVHAKHPNTMLVIVGDGVLEPELKTHIEALHLENHIRLTGFVPCAFEKLKAFDAFVLSSIQEAFGRVLIEAMLARCPIIATRVNGIPEVVGDTATLVPARNPDAFARAMLTLLEQTPEARSQIIELAYDRVYKNFSIPAFETTFWNLPLFHAKKETA
jgi:glycosyltransferase involved in cell wall biosynthesis